MKPLNQEYWGDDVRMFVGVVESPTDSDPLKLGRVKVRIHGLHSESTDDIPTEDLPWARVAVSTDHAGTPGKWSSGIQPGAVVCGFFIDGKLSQDGIITNSVPYNPAIYTESQINQKRAGKSRFAAAYTTTESNPDVISPAQLARKNLKPIAITSGDVPEKCYDWMFNWLVSTRSNNPAVHAAAICGQIQAESRFDTTVKASGTERSYGLMQWNMAVNRKQKLDEFASRNGRDWTDLEIQLQFIAYELENGGTPASAAGLLRTSTISDSTEYLLRRYTIPKVAVDYNALSDIQKTQQNTVVQKFLQEKEKRSSFSSTILNNYGG